MRNLVACGRLFSWRRAHKVPAPVPGERPVIRAMRVSDLREVLRIEGEIYEFPWPRRAFEDCSRLGYHCILVCQPSSSGRQQTSGYGIMELGSTQAHICNVSVARDRHRQGIGRTLMNSMLRTAQGKGMLSAYLEVRPSNHGAQDFYKTLGFQHESTKQDYYRRPTGFEDAWVFRRELN